MPTAHEFAEVVARQVGVRWRKHGRDPARGFDCAGPIVWGMQQVGLTPADSRDYDAAMPPSDLLWRLCRANCDEATWQDCGEGRVGLCAQESGGPVRHLLVMLTRQRIVHVDARVRRVTIVPASWMATKLAAVFRVRGLDYGAPW